MEHLEYTVKIQEITLQMQTELLKWKFKNPGKEEHVKASQGRIDKLNFYAAEMTGKIINHQTFKTQLAENEFYFNQLLDKL